MEVPGQRLLKSQQTSKTLDHQTPMMIQNITPNSFSDGDPNLTSQKIADNLVRWRTQGVRCFDFGAESTAPFNGPISASEEVGRFEQFLFPLVESKPALFENALISIDTYRPETFFTVYKAMSKRCSQANYIWNDVSGVLDEAVVKACQLSDVNYVYSHNLAQSRMHTGDHMSFIYDQQESKFLNKMYQYFYQAQNFFKNHNLQEKVLFDPCFGFSKTKEQNIYLLDHLKSWMERFDDINIWLIGISRKSFLRDADASIDKKFMAADIKLKNFLQLAFTWQNHAKMIHRVHDFDLWNSAKMTLKT